MKYRVEVPGPTSGRYVNRSLGLTAHVGWGPDRLRPLDASPGAIEFECHVPHRDELVGVIDGDCFTLLLVEWNSTGSRDVKHELIPTRLED